MRREFIVTLASLLLVVGPLVSCTDDAQSVPSPEQLSASLLAVEDLEGDWSLFSGPQGGDEELDPSGILTEKQRELVPSLDLCEDASDDAKLLVEELRPVVFRQLNLAVDDEIDPPFDRTGHLIFLQELLYSSSETDMADTFMTIREGLVECLGEIPAGEEGPGRAEELPVPDVGDERFGVLTTIEEAGGWAEWNIRNVFLREGPVMLSLVLVDIRAGDDPYFSDDDFFELVTVAVEKL